MVARGSDGLGLLATFGAVNGGRVGPAADDKQICKGVTLHHPEL